MPSKDSRREVNHLRLRHDLEKFFNKGQMRWVLLGIIVSIFNTIEFDDEGMSDTILQIPTN